VFFICCYSGDAWTLIFTAAQAAGPFNIHGCTCIIHPFPKPTTTKFIQGANQLAQRSKKWYVHTDRLYSTTEMKRPARANTTFVARPTIR
jgi:hypothetical protein